MSALAGGTAVFMILEPDELIGSDLAETIGLVEPQAVIHRARSVEEAMEILAGLPGLTAAFLRLPTRDLAEGTVPDAVEALGGRVVVLDAPGAAARADWLHTGRPYRADAIVAALACVRATP